MISNVSFLAAKEKYDSSDIVIFGCPLDTSTSFRPGTRFGPDAIRSASNGIETYSPILDLDLEQINFLIVIIFVLFSVFILFFISIQDIKIIKRFLTPTFLFLLFLLLLVPLVGVEVKGAKRWLDFVIFPRFQPIELLKPFFILLTAKILVLESNSNLYKRYKFIHFFTV